MNLKLAEKLILNLIKVGVREFCVCAGARNSPLVFVLSEAQGIHIYNFFDERSAAFFALGKIRAKERPVAVVTTSGTAVAELLPAAVEATYTGQPLLFVTADRPKKYRGTGAPQSIEQIGLFSHYVEKYWDIDFEQCDFDFSEWTGLGPAQVNVCFEEPQKENAVKVLSATQEPSWGLRNKKKTGSDSEKIFIDKPLVIVGGLNESDRQIVAENLVRLGAPIYAESISGLRNHPHLKSLLLGSEKSVRKIFDKKICTSVLRIGSIPTLRFWRDLEESFCHIKVFSASESKYSGLSRESVQLSSCANVANVFTERRSHEDLSCLFSIDKETTDLIEKKIAFYSKGEPALIQKWLQKIGHVDLYVGNSMPIREVDLVLKQDNEITRWMANRGANGIDGQISTYLGWSLAGKESWCLVGDLTALYDLSSLWISKQIEPAKRRILVVNNSGGKIFENIFSKEIFLNRHELSFQKWAEMFGWSYQKWTEVPEQITCRSENEIIELVPDNEQSQKFWSEYSKI